MVNNLPSEQKTDWADNQVVRPVHTNGWGEAINTLSKAVPLYSACGNVYTATYTNNVYNLTPLSFTDNTSNVTVDSYVDGMSVIFQCPTNNLANCSVNVNSLGAKTIKTIDNVNLPAGKLNSGCFVELRYDKTNDCFKFQQDFNKADRNFSNLTEEAEKHFLNKAQITNCILEAPNGIVTYSGNTITIKSGIKVLMPNGLNADRSFKSTEYIVSADHTETQSADALFQTLFVCKSSYLANEIFHQQWDGIYIQGNEPTTINPTIGAMWYNPYTNKWKRYNSAEPQGFEIDVCPIANYVTDSSGNIIHLSHYNTLSLYGRKDNKYISSLPMPSNFYKDLTLASSGSTYISKANGYFFFRGKTTATNSSIFLQNQTANLMEISQFTPFNNVHICAFMPVKNGDTFILTYTNIDKVYFRFIYANGEVK